MNHPFILRPTKRRTALILSGGGARGAYEVGVLWYVFEELSRLLKHPPRIDIISGTSIGAVNGAFLASRLDDPILGVRRLVQLWSELQLGSVLGFGLKQVMSFPRLLFGGSSGAGLFDVTPMAHLVQNEISWREITNVLKNRKLFALTVSATEVSTGRTVVFMQTSPESSIPSNPPPRTLFRADHIGPTHALASAAIPILFPPVRIGDQLYVDGGLRQNTPISPALKLGGTHIFAIGSSREVKGIVTKENSDQSQLDAKGILFLLGKVLNAFLLDHIDVDMELLSRINQILSDGVTAYGDSFMTSVSDAAKKRGSPGYSPVSCIPVRPSEDLGCLAGAHVRRGKFLGHPILAKRLLSFLDIGAGDEADLASYLLFDGIYCRQLIELGRSDAHARRYQLMQFFDDAENLADTVDNARDSQPA